MIQALVFDFDGTIIDTEQPDYVSWQGLFRAYDVTLSFQVWQETVGLADDSFDIHAYLESLIGRPIDRVRAQAQRRRRFIELVEQQPLRPGVAAYLDQASRLGLRLGIASSNTREWVTWHLQRRDLAGYFDCVFTADDVTRPKPDPALYRLAIEALAAQPEEAIALEDSPAGVWGAVRAGLFTVAIPNAATSEMDFGHAHLRLESLADMPLHALLPHAVAQQQSHP